MSIQPSNSHATIPEENTVVSTSSRLRTLPERSLHRSVALHVASYCSPPTYSGCVSDKVCTTDKER